MPDRKKYLNPVKNNLVSGKAMSVYDGITASSAMPAGAGSARKPHSANWKERMPEEPQYITTACSFCPAGR